MEAQRAIKKMKLSHLQDRAVARNKASGDEQMEDVNQ